MSSRARGVFMLGALACALGSPRALSAHDFPTPFRLLFDAQDAARSIVALRPGLALSENGGENWDFVCGGVTGIAGGDAYAIAIAPSGRLLIGAFTALYRDDGSGCGWTRITDSGLPGRAVALMTRESGVLEALTAAPGADNGLFASEDDGLTFRAHGAPIAGAMPNSMQRAPSDPRRIYVAGTRDDASAVALWVSSDDGGSWDEKALGGVERAEVIGVDPLRAGRVYVLRVSTEPGSVPDRVDVSDDGGETFRALIQVAAFGGLALTPDATTLFVGDRDGGLHRIDSGGATQLLHAELHVGCVAVRDDRLWLCARDQTGFDRFAIATSTDRGETLVPYLHSSQVRRLRTCGNPVQAMTCAGEWNQWKNDVFGSTAEPPAATPDAGVDAAVREPAPPARDAAVAQAAPPDARMRDTAGCHAAPGAVNARLTAWFVIVIAFALAWLARPAARVRRMARDEGAFR